MMEDLNDKKTYISKINSFKEVLKDIKNNPFGKCSLYKEKNEVIGFLYYSDIYDRIEINQFEVLEKEQNKGIASKLLEKLILNNKDITLEVRKDNYKAINLYKKYDFKEIAIRKNYYKEIDGILMERKKDS